MYMLYIVDCISNECTNSTPSRPNITVGFNDGAEYIVETARTVANLGTSLSDFIGLFGFI